jgi:glycosyltransferase involved in cell wall biosynthesis
MKLPLSVIIPTKNSMRYLEAHVAGLSPWFDLVEEFIVVDSHSTDGSVEYLRTYLPAELTRFLSHPPGLYASWNYGISQVISTYFFIATTGDTIPADGIKKLVTAAGELNADVVISKPTFRGEDGQPRSSPRWPIDDIIEILGCTGNRRLSQLEALLFTATHPEGAMLGSSASNLYRTATFQRFPFPTQFGAQGDGVWGWFHAPEITWGVIPDQISSFLLHPHTGHYPQKHILDKPSAATILSESMQRWVAQGTVDQSTYDRLRWNQLINLLSTYLDAKMAFDSDRRKAVPWPLNPKAWQNRAARNSAKQRLHQLKQEILCLPSQRN